MEAPPSLTSHPIFLERVKSVIQESIPGLRPAPSPLAGHFKGGISGMAFAGSLCLGGPDSNGLIHYSARVKVTGRTGAGAEFYDREGIIAGLLWLDFSGDTESLPPEGVDKLAENVVIHEMMDVAEFDIPN